MIPTEPISSSGQIEGVSSITIFIKCIVHIMVAFDLLIFFIFYFWAVARVRLTLLKAALLRLLKLLVHSTVSCQDSKSFYLWFAFLICYVFWPYCEARRQNQRLPSRWCVSRLPWLLCARSMQLLWWEILLCLSVVKLESPDRSAAGDADDTRSGCAEWLFCSSVCWVCVSVAMSVGGALCIRL